MQYAHAAVTQMQAAQRGQPAVQVYESANRTRHQATPTSFRSISIPACHGARAWQVEN